MELRHSNYSKKMAIYQGDKLMPRSYNGPHFPHQIRFSVFALFCPVGCFLSFLLNEARVGARLRLPAVDYRYTEMFSLSRCRQVIHNILRVKTFPAWILLASRAETVAAEFAYSTVFAGQKKVENFFEVIKLANFI